MAKFFRHFNETSTNLTSIPRQHHHVIARLARFRWLLCGFTQTTIRCLPNELLLRIAKFALIIHGHELSDELEKGSLIFVGDSPQNIRNPVTQLMVMVCADWRQLIEENTSLWSHVFIVFPRHYTGAFFHNVAQRHLTTAQGHLLKIWFSMGDDTPTPSYYSTMMLLLEEPHRVETFIGFIDRDVVPCFITSYPQLKDLRVFVSDRNTGHPITLPGDAVMGRLTNLVFEGVEETSDMLGRLTGLPLTRLNVGNYGKAQIPSLFPFMHRCRSTLVKVTVQYLHEGVFPINIELPRLQFLALGGMLTSTSNNFLKALTAPRLKVFKVYSGKLESLDSDEMKDEVRLATALRARSFPAFDIFKEFVRRSGNHDCMLQLDVYDLNPEWTADHIKSLVALFPSLRSMVLGLLFLDPASYADAVQHIPNVVRYQMPFDTSECRVSTGKADLLGSDLQRIACAARLFGQGGAVPESTAYPGTGVQNVDHAP
ncbi:hypothetical protein V5O48_012690 [Marasmius crinis-equi]|uniref:F-box domain-containing protein n=1 Tax=Marasmius crinis-equi TaxID=585013 RepID=A0ABR3F248_9AGAR